MLEVYECTQEPEKSCYILGDQNHVGFYQNGYVYYFGFTEEEGYPRKAELSDWCCKWTYLRPCCIASKEEFVEAMGGITEFEPHSYTEVEWEK